MNISALIQAAEFLDRKDREAEHGYASMLPHPAVLLRSDRKKQLRLRQQPLQGCRSSHNELEKNRRAQMKQCLEQLKAIVPLAGDATRHTTLGLLINATSVIKNLRETERQQKALKDQLVHEQQYLSWRMEQMKNGGCVVGSYRVGGQYRVRPSVSESSNASTESSGTTSSELDDIDVTGSGLSDVDDRSNDNCCLSASERLVTCSL